MPEEQLGFGPAALEHPETDSFSSKEESLVGAPEAEKKEQDMSVQEGSKKYEKLLQSVPVATVTSAANNDDTKVDLEHLQTLEAEEEKVEQLVKLAHTKGLAHAVQVAERLKDYYALDMFHDTIVDNLYDALLKEGLIKSE